MSKPMAMRVSGQRNSLGDFYIKFVILGKAKNPAKQKKHPLAL